MENLRRASSNERFVSCAYFSSIYRMVSMAQASLVSYGIEQVFDVSKAITPYEFKRSDSGNSTETKLILQLVGQKGKNSEIISYFCSWCAIKAGDIGIQSARGIVICDFASNNIHIFKSFVEILKQASVSVCRHKVQPIQIRIGKDFDMQIGSKVNFVYRYLSIVNAKAFGDDSCADILFDRIRDKRNRLSIGRCHIEAFAEIQSGVAFSQIYFGYGGIAAVI